jgi:hypothetical protein
LVPSATDTAVIGTSDGLGADAGAVYTPEGSIVPNVVLPPWTFFALQITPVLVVPVTVAVNCWLPFGATVAEGGDTETVMLC